MVSLGVLWCPVVIRCTGVIVRAGPGNISEVNLIDCGLSAKSSIGWAQTSGVIDLNLNSLLVKRQIDNPSPGFVAGGN